MSKYFKEKQTKKIKLSEYLKLDESEFKCFLCDEKYRITRTKYIMDIIGDVELDYETYELFLIQFQRFGGRYDVRTKSETFKGIYEISQKYSFLTTAALEEIWFVYIHDQFEEYALVDVLGEYIKSLGKEDETFVRYMEYIDKTAEEYDKQFILEAMKLDEYSKDYGSELIKHLKYMVKSQHILAGQIISSLPSSELIIRDVKQLHTIIDETRIYFGACYPISYQMIESLAVGDGLDCYPDHPKYMISGKEAIDATFTKQEFLDSIKESKKVLKRRK